MSLTRRFTKAYYYLPLQIICFGIIFWAIGGFIWLYYNLIEDIEQPYPSLADAGYAPAAIAIIMGCAMLHKKTTKDQLAQLIIVAFVTIISGFGLFSLMWLLRGGLFLAGKDPWKMVLDVGYPLADIISLTFLLLTYISGKQEILHSDVKRMLRLIASGMMLYFIADISFSITTTLPDDNPLSYVPGSFPDLVFMITFWLLSLAVIRMPILRLYKWPMKIV